MISLDMVLTPDAAGHVCIDPADSSTEAMGGGSRAGFLGLAKAMARRGDYAVRAFTTFNKRRQVIGGLECLRLDERVKSEHAQVSLAYYDTSPLMGCKSDLRIASHHTLIPYLAAVNWIDVHTAPCAYAVEHLRRNFAPLAEWAVLPNAVEGLDGIAWAPVPGRVIYHTSPDRGLHLLAEMWPHIRATVPGASLHVVGDMAEACNPQGTPERSVGGRRAARLKRAIEALQAMPEAAGLTLCGRLPRAELLRELSEASCFAFPCSVVAPCETWSTSILESLVIGVPVVLAPQDALKSLWADYVNLVDTPTDAPEFQGVFASEVVRTLVDTDGARRMSERGRGVGALLTFDKSAEALDRIIQSNIKLDA
jgi:glycosyl transferase family 1